jgi:serine/threonine-protein kinase RsbW
MRRIHLSLASEYQNIDLVDAVTEACLRFAGFDATTTEHMTLAIREAAANAIKHGNGQDPTKLAEVTFDIDTEAITIRIKDQGTGFDPEGLPDPLSPENILKGTGRGIFLMRQLMDEVGFRFEEGSEVTLRKALPGSDGRGAGKEEEE